MRLLKAMSWSVLLLAMTLTATAQLSTANLGGKVFDPRGSVIPNAAVDVTSQETGEQQHVKTNNSGDWLVRSLNPGHYTFDVSAPGFKTTQHAAVELQVADQKSIDTILAVGDASEKVEVTSTTPLLDTTAAVSGTVITQEQLETLPSYTNSPTALAALAPGVIMGNASGGGVHLWSNTSASNLTADGAGSGSQAVNYQIEGGTDSNNGGQIAFIPPMDSVGEFRVSTNAYDAQISRVSSATIDLQIKAGTRDFHGTVYEFNQNNFLNAIPYNNGAKGVVPPQHVNEFGGGVGGPVWIPKVFDGRKHHTFFFFNYDGIRAVSPATNPTYQNLPTALEREGDFSQSFTVTNGVKYPVQIYDPKTADPVTGARQLINGGSEKITVSPTAKAIFALMPLPNNPLGNDGTSSDGSTFLGSNPKIDVFNSYLGRIDNSFTENHHTYGEYRYNHLVETSGDPFGPDNILSSQQLLRTNWGLTVDHAWVVSPTFLLDFRGNATWYQSANVSLSYGVDPKGFGYSDAIAGLGPKPSIPCITGVANNWPITGMGTCESPKFSNDALYEGKVIATQTAGNHSIKYGVEYLIQQEADNNLGASAGTFNYGNNWNSQFAGSATSNPNSTSSVANVAAFELDLPNNSSSYASNASAFWSQPFLGFFVQDDWRVSSRFTVNLGLRWDYQGGLTERFNRFWSQFDPTVNVAPVTAVAQPAYAATLAGTGAGVQFLQQWRPNPATFVARGEIEYAGVDGVSRNLTEVTKKYFQPRIGFAYRLHPNTVIRGGVGRFVQASWNTGNQDGFSTTTPYHGSNDSYFTQAATQDDPYSGGLNPVNGSSLGGLQNVGGNSSFNQPRVPRVYVDEASAHLEQQFHNWLFELGATLNMTHNLSIGYNQNLPTTPQWLAANTPTFAANGLPSATLPGNNLVANPFFGAPYITNGTQTAKTISAYQLSLPNPLFNSLTENIYKGKNNYYAGQSKLERRYQNGLGLLASFSWSKDMNINTFPVNQAVSQKLLKQLSNIDQRFVYTITPTYMLPFGRGQLIGGHANYWTDLAIGGWQLSGIFTYNTGTPLNLPTNSAFFEGGDPGIGHKTRQHQFDTSKFAAFPNISTTLAQLGAYPAWTGVLGLPGAGYHPPTATSSPQNGVYQDFATWRPGNPTYFGDVRNPSYINLDLGLRKAFPIHERTRVELRFDAFNSLNHPVFTGAGTSASSPYFGYLSGNKLLSVSNTPRAIQLAGKFYF